MKPNCAKNIHKLKANGPHHLDYHNHPHKVVH